MEEVNIKSIFKLFLPLALASWVSTLIPPLINAGIVRVSDDPEAALASYSVARNLIWLLAPFAVMVPNAFLVLVKNKNSYKRFRNFLVILCGIFLGIGLIVIYTPLKIVVLEILMGLTPSLAQKTEDALKVFLIFPLVSIWRAFSQGILIQRHQTRILLWGGIAGFLTLLAGVLLSRYLIFLPGAIYGAIMVILATGADASILHWKSRIWAGNTTSELQGEKNYLPTYLQIFNFFLR